MLPRCTIAATRGWNGVLVRHDTAREVLLHVT